MSKEQENLKEQRRQSKYLRRLRARFEGKIKDKVRNPGFTFDSRDSSQMYQNWAAQW